MFESNCYERWIVYTFSAELEGKALALTEIERLFGQFKVFVIYSDSMGYFGEGLLARVCVLMAGKKIDINTATVNDLEFLAGVGHHRAEAIVKHRKESGGFQNVVELSQVPGISPTIIDQNKDRIVCRAKASPEKRKNGPELPKRTTRQHNQQLSQLIKPLSLANTPQPEPSCSGSDSASAFPSPFPSHFTRSQKAALLQLVGDQPSCLSTDTPPAESFSSSSSCRGTKRGVTGGVGLKLHQASSSQEDDSGNDGDDERDERVASHDCRNAGSVGERPRENNFFQNVDQGQRLNIDLEEEEEAEAASDGEGSISDGNGSCEEGSVLGHHLDTVNNDVCDNDDVVDQRDGDTDDDDDNFMDSSCSSTGCHKACLGMSSRTRSTCSLKVEGESSGSALSRQSTLKRKTSFAREERDQDVDQDSSPGKKLRMALVSCHVCGQSLAKVPRWRLAQMPRGKIPSKENPPAKMDDWLKTFQAWSNAERMMAVDELINLCDPTQVRHMMQVIEPQFQRDFISLLPKELALYVLSFMEPRDLLRAAQTCRYWRVLAEDNLLWREKCREEGIDEEMVYGSRMRRRLSAARSPYKSLYMRQSQIEHNWRTGVNRPPKHLKGHDDHVITCLEFCGNRVVSGSDDNTLKVWSVTSGKCLRTLIGHTGGVWSSQMSGTVVISGSTDRTLKVWNAETGQCRHTLYGHSSTVRCMSLHENQVVSGSRDATLRVWDIDTGECQHILMGHQAAVRCVQFDGRKVVSGAYDYTVRVWDPETETCLHTLQGHSNRVYSLQFDGIHVVSGSLDTSIRVWDVETGNCLHTLIGHQSLTSGLELKNNILVSGNADSTVKVWDITTGQCLQTLQGPNKHQSAVTCLQFSKKFVITSSDDGTVKIWDLKSGEFLRNLVTLGSGGSGGVVWRLRCSNTRLVCAVGSRNGTEETKLMVLDFDVEDPRDRKFSALGGSQDLDRRLLSSI
ncbi:F-box/WD repeat-containing protein 7 [Plakobranchus ocellatus]|uniref:F-box/WD repeat-containing protein 7 n=1 Tax=Plakobranchus ocellatus TaxID=259542 RepID=A0AAV4DMM8_9GAST|nr:F-box/WD repeat-containing protein 7 [Plakobranchus ocellatus]